MTNRLNLLLVSVAIIAIAACGSGESDSQKTVTGQVIDVQALTIDAFSSLTIRDEHGRDWTFKGGLFTGFTPSHLIAHRAEGQAVVVTYSEDSDGSLRAVKLEDG